MTDRFLAGFTNTRWIESASECITSSPGRAPLPTMSSTMGLEPASEGSEARVRLAHGQPHALGSGRHRTAQTTEGGTGRPREQRQDREHRRAPHEGRLRRVRGRRYRTRSSRCGLGPCRSGTTEKLTIVHSPSIFCSTNWPLLRNTCEPLLPSPLAWKLAMPTTEAGYPLGSSRTLVRRTEGIGSMVS